MIHARIEVTEEGWREAIDRLADGSTTLLGLWADGGDVLMATSQDDSDISVISYTCRDGRFPSVGAKHPPAIRLERAIGSLFGLKADGAIDSRPWLDLGFWEVAQPLGARTPATPAVPYQFLPVEGEGLHEIAVGPVHAGIIEPGHFRFTANGEHVVRLEQRLGYVHKGIEGLMQGASLAQAAKLAGRTSGDSTVAYAYAFALATEQALQTEAPPRAAYLRALMAELERLANHLGDIGAICNDAAFALMLAHMGVLRERTLRAADACFGHRLMRDVIVPGGVARDIAPDGITALRSLLATIRDVFPRLVALYDNTASLQDRTVTTGIVKPDYARQFGAGGYVGRASGRAYDARRALRYAPYDVLNFDVPVREDGDVNARVWIRILEVEQSLKLIEQIIDRLPDGPLATTVEPKGACEGLAMTEAFRGDVLVWLRLDDAGRVARCHVRDASWFQWPLLETAIEGNIVADFPLCNKSFNCSYSGHDL
ncbi:hydrogenase expression protein HypE [Pseudolabrys taiwanensis]|uniref:Hydrogenase expression protein HypE n=1 Tax=Pseudolabrys taiwanensis TaxID=331696 RepID=A0A345ZWS3_9HYPH|nr:hydrogenase expression protein HypE [Pseudolabrys taiwanensis]AXK81370.1 hydrogenase expression protein HypE [Pseudolabrys taiwanensis]